MDEERHEPAVPDDAEAPEADALEQEVVVEEEQILVRGEQPSEATEADWLEQTIVEPIDEEER